MVRDLWRKGLLGLRLLESSNDAGDTTIMICAVINHDFGNNKTFAAPLAEVPGDPTTAEQLSERFPHSEHGDVEKNPAYNPKTAKANAQKAD